MKNSTILKVQYIVAVILYGTNGLLLRNIDLPSEVVVLFRGILGSLFVAGFLLAGGKGFHWQEVRRNAGWLVISGVSLGLNWVFLFAAYRYTTVAIASLCNYMAPVIVVLLSPALLKERLNGKKLLCVAGAFCGILLVSGVLGGELSQVNLPGLGLGMGAALGFVGIVLCNKKIRNVPAYDRVLVQLAVSAVTVLPYVLWLNGGVPLPADGRSTALLLTMGLVQTGIAYVFYFGGMAALPVQTIAVLGYIEPVVSVLCSALLLHEPLTPLGVMGAALILCAAAASEIL